MALRAMCFQTTDLFPNTVLSSSRTEFSFTCSSFRLSAASGSSCSQWEWPVRLLLLLCSLLCLYPSLVRLYPNSCPSHLGPPHKA